MAKNTYYLGKRIARGGMAEIYLGKAVGEAAFQKIVAIKRILPHYSQDKEFIEMFRDEAHICKRLQHNNIVQVYDFTEVDGSYALVMEHVDGADLRSLLSACESAKTRLSVPMALYIAACAARALHYAHTKTDELTSEALGIVHRDISPQNILISYEGDVKITDFGIASAENKLTETRPGVVKGKYSYMSPEQVAAKPLDGRSDVFSLAIVLWETLAMKRLFAGMTEVESIRKVQNCEISYDLGQLNSEVDGELKTIVMKGLSKDRKLRYQTAAAFEKDLLRYLHSHYSEFTSRELGNFLKRILAKKRDRTQDDIKETLAQPAPSNPHPSQTTIQSSAMQGGAAINLSTGAGLLPGQDILKPSLADERATPIQPLALDPKNLVGLIEDKNITVSGSFKKNNPSRLIAIDSMVHESTNARNARSRVTQGPSLAPPKKKKSSPLPLVLFLSAFLGFGAYYFKDDLMVDRKLHFELRSSPDVVSLKINGVKLDEGAFKRTPIKLHLAPGTYELEISRPGYQREVIRFQGNSGETLRPEKVFLKRLPNVTLYPVRIISSASKVFVDVNRGLFEGETPLNIEVLPLILHSVTFRSLEDGSTFKCPFKVDRPNPLGAIPTLVITPPTGGQKARCQFKI